MASIYRHGSGWRAQVSVRGERDSDTFRTRAEAARWALEREAELRGAKLPDRTLAAALTRYGRDVSPSHRGETWELRRLAAMAKAPIAGTLLADLRTPHLVAWRDERLREVAPGTVAREMNLLRSVLRTAWKEWHWLRDNPLADVKPPTTPTSRKRRVTDDEIERLMLAADVTGTEHGTAMQRTMLAFLFALETAMRAGEIVGLRWEDVGAKSVNLPLTKNGDARRVPLSRRAREIIAALPRTDRPVFDLDAGTRDVMWRRIRDATGIPNLRFHDSRAEAIWRLSRPGKLDVLELARVIGHRDPKSLLIYYQADADELADRL